MTSPAASTTIEVPATVETTALATTVPPPPSPGELVASGVAPGEGTLFAAGSWFVKIDPTQGGFVYTAHDPAAQRERTFEFGEDDLPFMNLVDTFAVTGPSGLGVFVMVGENVTAANGLTPESKNKMVFATKIEEPTTAGLLWLKEFGEVEIEVGCGMLLVTDHVASTSAMYDVETQALVADLPYVRLGQVLCSGRQFVLDGMWIDLDTGTTKDVSNLLLYETNGRFAKGDGVFFDLTTGAVVFDVRAAVGGAEGSVVDPPTNTVVVHSYDLIGFDLATQTERWRIPGDIIDEADLELNNASDGVVRGYTGAPLSGDRQLVAIDALTGEQLWAGGEQNTYNGSDSRAALSIVQTGSYIALDFGEAGVQIFAAGRPLLGVDFGTVVFR